MKWKVPASEPKEFKFSVDTNQSKPPWDTNRTLSVQIWKRCDERNSRGTQIISSDHNLVFGKTQVETKQSQEPGRMGRTIRKRRKLSQSQGR